MLNIANLEHSTRNLGPGERAVVWVQGCPHRCAGCIAPEWLPFEPALQYSPEELVDDLLRSESISGLTFSGGEPMAQAAELAKVAWLAKQKRDVDIICFSGYRLEQLQKFPLESGVAELLDVLDVLIDGAYVRALNNGIGLRGSSNQRIIHLTSRLKGKNLEEFPRRVDIKIGADEMMMVGIPPLSLEPILLELFSQKGSLAAGAAR